jgi:hypothetical protein
VLQGEPLVTGHMTIEIHEQAKWHRSIGKRQLANWESPKCKIYMPVSQGQ